MRPLVIALAMCYDDRIIDNTTMEDDMSIKIALALLIVAAVLWIGVDNTTTIAQVVTTPTATLPICEYQPLPTGVVATPVNPGTCRNWTRQYNIRLPIIIAE